jgi:hypothetical protein
MHEVSKVKTDGLARDDFNVSTQSSFLFEELGRRMEVKEVAAFFGVDEDTVRKEYRAYGGYKPNGNRKGRIHFFEKMVSETVRRAVHGDTDNQKREEGLAREGNEGWEDEIQTFSHKKGGGSVGGSRKKGRLVEDRHGILAH